jgi:hypothetical protein
MSNNTEVSEELQAPHDRLHDFEPVKSILPRVLDHLLPQWEHARDLRRMLEPQVTTPFHSARSQALDEAIVSEESLATAIADHIIEEGAVAWRR